MVNPESSSSDKEIIITRDNRNSECRDRSIELGTANNDCLRFVVDEIIDNPTTVHSYDFFYKYPISDIERLFKQVFDEDNMDEYNVISGAFVHFFVNFPGFRGYGKLKGKENEAMYNKINNKKLSYYGKKNKYIDPKDPYPHSKVRRNQSKNEFYQTMDKTFLECGFAPSEAKEDMGKIISTLKGPKEKRASNSALYYLFRKKYYPLYLALREKGYSHHDVAL